ncbi:MAG: hypothetical protein DRQ10_08385 [Candidatus Hydrothermota bacterium]|nr:MAG: hypothetical protein DRQ10_08385 [Candidatus Hydrothermae bacterium]
MKILSFDPSISNTGLAVVDFRNFNSFNYSTHLLRSPLRHRDKFQKQKSVELILQRLLRQLEQFRKLSIPREGVVVIEAPPLYVRVGRQGHHLNTLSILKLTAATWFWVGYFTKEGREVHLVPAPFSRKRYQQTSHATKAQAYYALQSLGIPVNKMSEHERDALSLALYFVSNISDLTKRNL